MTSAPLPPCTHRAGAIPKRAPPTRPQANPATGRNALAQVNAADAGQAQRAYVAIRGWLSRTGSSPTHGIAPPHSSHEQGTRADPARPHGGRRLAQLAAGRAGARVARMGSPWPATWRDGRGRGRVGWQVHLLAAGFHFSAPVQRPILRFSSGSCT
jgi:hypothetical protein